MQHSEIRSLKSDFQTRADENTGDMYINGYFAVFDSEYEICPGAIETIAPTAFNDVLEDDIRCLTDHDSRLVLGRTKAGTFKCKIDKKGLWGEVKINPKDSDAVNLYERVKRGDVDQCSFGFDILEEDYEQLDGSVKWTIKKVKLYEVSIVTFPAYTETSVEARTKQLDDINKRELAALKLRLIDKLKGE